MDAHPGEDFTSWTCPQMSDSDQQAAKPEKTGCCSVSEPFTSWKWRCDGLVWFEKVIIVTSFKTSPQKVASDETECIVVSNKTAVYKNSINTTFFAFLFQEFLAGSVSNLSSACFVLNWKRYLQTDRIVALPSSWAAVEVYAMWCQAFVSQSGERRGNCAWTSADCPHLIQVCCLNYLTWQMCLQKFPYWLWMETILQSDSTFAHFSLSFKLFRYFHHSLLQSQDIVAFTTVVNLLLGDTIRSKADTGLSPSVSHGLGRAEKQLSLVNRREEVKGSVLTFSQCLGNLTLSVTFTVCVCSQCS